MQALGGFTVGVTADRRAGEQVELFEGMGAAVVHGACLRSVVTAEDRSLRAVTAALIDQPPAVVVANTAVGMRRWLALAQVWGMGERLLVALRSTRIVARGAQVAGAVVREGLEVAWRAPSETLAEVLAHVAADVAGAPGTRVALQSDGGGSPGAADALRAAGATVVAVDVYRWVPPADPVGPRRLVDAVLDGRVDVVTFTAAPAVRGFLSAAGPRRARLVSAFARGRVTAACVGPHCAAAAGQGGLGEVLVPPRARLAALVRSVALRLQERVSEVRLAGVPVRVQGTLLEVDGTTVELTARERWLFHALLGRHDVMCSKSSLSRTAWTGAVDDHTVEVTVNRLRRKLGPVSTALETTARRGYRLVTDTR
jgi:uroporphyrinogen-III synthase